MTATAAPASGGPVRAPLPWGRWSLRGAALSYLALFLVAPLLVIVHDGVDDGLGALWDSVTEPVAWHALWLTLWTACVMAAINAVMGTLAAFVLVRYEFRGRRFLDALVDLPLAIPTLVTGVMLVALYGPQTALGGWLKQSCGIAVIFAPPGIVLAILFLTFPLIVRSVQPVLHDLEREPEDAAATLGASGLTIFRRVTLPALVGPLATGTLLSFARAIGEFGSIVVVAGNIPLRTQTAAVYVLGEVESDNRRGASGMSVVLLALTFVLFLVMDWIQRRSRRAGP